MEKLVLENKYSYKIVVPFFGAALTVLRGLT